MISSLVWAGVVLVGIVLAYRATVTVFGRKLATKAEVAELGATVDAMANRLLKYSAEVDKAFIDERKRVNGFAMELTERINAIDDRTNPEKAIVGNVAPRRRL